MKHCFLVTDVWGFFGHYTRSCLDLVLVCDLAFKSAVSPMSIHQSSVMKSWSILTPQLTVPTCLRMHILNPLLEYRWPAGPVIFTLFIPIILWCSWWHLYSPTIPVVSRQYSFPEYHKTKITVAISPSVKVTHSSSHAILLPHDQSCFHYQFISTCFSSRMKSTTTTPFSPST